ncbi:MAG TPA: uracil-DNA glycosylase [Gemmatimonadota bacterium]|nr:uracil-DNA glycosylase [Gemmatimonadota bacterium]
MDAGEALRRYLQTRRSLGEPEVVFPALDRRAARRMTRRLVIGGVLAPVREAEAGQGGGRAAPSAASAAPEPAAASEKAPAAGSDPGAGEPAAEASPSLSEDEIGRLAREGTGEEIRQVPDLASLRRVVEACERCPLHRARTREVFGEGDPHARVVCVGEAPGAREDETGRPFVGPAGQLLDRLLLSVGFRREEVYICNVLKSRPPNNRDPQPDEIEACSPYLHRQLELIDPDVVVAFGAFAARTLLDATGSLGSLRGKVHRYRGYPLVATYHPAALLRNRSWTRPTWEDLQRVRAIVDGERAEGESGIQAGQQMGLI